MRGPAVLVELTLTRVEEIIHNVNLDNYEIIVLVVGCCSLYDR